MLSANWLARITSAPTGPLSTVRLSRSFTSALACSYFCCASALEPFAPSGGGYCRTSSWLARRRGGSYEQLGGREKGQIVSPTIRVVPSGIRVWAPLRSAAQTRP